MKRLELIIHGNPIALKRHRTVKTKSGCNINYDPSKTDKNVMLWKSIAEKKPKKPFEEALKVTCIFYMSRPKSHYRTGKYSGILKESAPIFHISKPDNDNLIKFVKDSLNGIYWKDDSIISTVVGRKVYTNTTPRTKIIIELDSLINK